MDNRGDIANKKDRGWILDNSPVESVFYFLGSTIRRKELSDDDVAYGIREALIARKMGLS